MMTYEIAPTTPGGAVTAFPAVTVRTINFTGNVTVTRGTGEKSNVITVRRDVDVGVAVTCSPLLVDAQDFTTAAYGGANEDISPGVTTAIVFSPDGGVAGRYVTPARNTVLTTFNWYSPHDGGAGSAHWIRFTKISGDAPGPSSAPLGVWLSLATAQTLSLFVAFTSEVAVVGTYKTEISPDAGVTICTTWTGQISASAFL